MMISKQTERAEKILKKRIAKGIDQVIGDEEIIDATVGMADGKALWKTVKMQCLVVLTPTRVAVSTNGGFKSEDMLLSKISSIDVKPGVLSSTVTFHASGNDLTVEKMADAADFVKNVKHHMSSTDTPMVTANTVDIADQLKKLADLKEQGILTEDEFSAQKTKLLDM